MELLGEILHFSKSGRLIIKIDYNKEMAKSGLLILDEREKRIGKIAELIGPVNSPYASIIPFIQNRSKMNGMKVYGMHFNKKNNNLRSRNKYKIKKNKK